MGCGCGSDVGIKQSVERNLANIIDLTMMDWLMTLGWYYVGLCGCRENFRMYNNKQYPEFTIWINSDGTKMQVKRFYGGSRDATLLGIGGQDNFKTIYDFHLNNITPITTQ